MNEWLTKWGGMNGVQGRKVAQAYLLSQEEGHRPHLPHSVWKPRLGLQKGTDPSRVHISIPYLPVFLPGSPFWLPGNCYDLQARTKGVTYSWPFFSSLLFYAHTGCPGLSFPIWNGQCTCILCAFELCHINIFIKILILLPKLMLCKFDFTFTLMRKSLLNYVRSECFFCNIFHCPVQQNENKGLGGRMEKRKLVICTIITELKSLQFPSYTEQWEDHKNSYAPGSELRHLKNVMCLVLITILWSRYHDYPFTIEPWRHEELCKLTKWLISPSLTVSEKPSFSI